MTVHDVAVAALFVGLCGAAVTGLVIAGNWITRRADRLEYANDTDILPTADDVARGEVEADTLVMLAQVRAALAQAEDILRGRSA